MGSHRMKGRMKWTKNILAILVTIQKTVMYGKHGFVVGSAHGMGWITAKTVTHGISKGGENMGYRRFLSAYDMSIAALREQEIRRWIPTTERMPEDIGMYLVIEKHWLDGSPGIKIAKWNTVDWFTADRKNNEITPRVTHWMPLPELPK